ncbi:MAG: 4Fe-4S binding protein [Spirochaetia bacterium]
MAQHIQTLRLFGKFPVLQRDTRFSLSLPASLILTFLMYKNMEFFLLAGGQSTASIIYTVYLTGLFFLMLYTGQIAFFRRIFFVGIALLIFPSFIANLLESRGHMALTSADIFQNNTPFCHIVTPVIIIPYALTQTIIFPAQITGHYASLLNMLIIWAIAAITLGRGWCSWVCFYGGWEDGVSRLSKKTRFKLNIDDDRIRYFGFAMLLFIVLLSLRTLTSVYCQWFCPFKLVTEYAEITGLMSYLSTILFIVAFFGLVIVLPFLTRKRFQCTTFCPFGAFQSIVGRVSPFRVRIDHDKCVSCMKCVQVCPTLSVKKSTITEKKGSPILTCTMCGECINACPKGAISYGYFGKDKSGTIFSGLKNKIENMKTNKAVKAVLHTGRELLQPQALFMFAGFTFGMIISGGLQFTQFR